VLLFKSTVSFADFLETIEVFLFFYVYSLGNVLAYNYLYFSKLDKEVDSPVIPTKEGTDFKIGKV
jgi:hypothetical protein